MELYLRTLALTALVLFALAVPAASFAQASETGSIAVTVENQQLTLAEDISLSFGTVQPFGRDGTVRVDANGNTFNIFTFNTVEGNPATWSLTGVPNAPYAVTLPSNSITVTSGTGETMAVTNFVRTAGGSQLSFDANGLASFNVGATLNVSALQTDGTYTGSYNLTVFYN